jgi:hypothetical protein
VGRDRLGVARVERLVVRTDVVDVRHSSLRRPAQIP